ncbi:type II toxin-antitoxin system toxin TscT [Staphylococcus haemolyticus]|uniref:type II toxin-antitoxin system toxin TscT n=1 Tax=Staphylococcus haemolyticus TaxID=1283 RepID=UPI0034DD97F0
MNFEQSNILCDLEVLKERIDDVVKSFMWFNEEYFTHEPNHVLSMEEIKGHGYRYHEHRIKNTQTIDLMLMYQKEFGELIERFKEIEKENDRAHDEIGNGRHNDEQ